MQWLDIYRQYRHITRDNYGLQMDKLVRCSVCRDVQDTIPKMREHLNETHRISDDAIRAWIDYLDMRVLLLEVSQ